jgi:broad specificity phosphatase PhoE
MMSNNTTNVFLVRHGQTEWNLFNRIQGQKNSPLSEAGKKQAYKIREKLKDKEIKVAYSSSLGRAVETAAIIIDDLPIKLIQRDTLNEIALGPWEGKTLEEAKKIYPVEYEQFWDYPEKYSLSGSETYHELQERTVHEINSIIDKNIGSNVLVVSHWIAIKVILAHFFNRNLSELSEVMDIKNGSYVMIEKKDKTVKIYYGED